MRALTNLRMGACMQTQQAGLITLHLESAHAQSLVCVPGQAIVCGSLSINFVGAISFRADTVWLLIFPKRPSFQTFLPGYDGFARGHGAFGIEQAQQVNARRQGAYIQYLVGHTGFEALLQHRAALLVEHL